MYTYLQHGSNANDDLTRQESWHDAHGEAEHKIRHSQHQHVVAHVVDAVSTRDVTLQRAVM